MKYKGWIIEVSYSESCELYYVIATPPESFPVTPFNFILSRYTAKNKGVENTIRIVIDSIVKEVESIMKELSEIFGIKPNEITSEQIQAFKELKRRGFDKKFNIF